MGFDYKESVVLSIPKHRLEVRHLLLSGSNFEIGEKLGELAQTRHSIQKREVTDPMIHECQREYLRRNYPIHLERMRGFAKAYGELLTDDIYDFSCFGNPLDVYGCSAVYYPPEVTENHHGIVCRNLDFFVDVSGEYPLSSVQNAFKRPYFMELHPDNGFSSLVFMTYEIFGLALEGINSEGLAVIHLADGETENSGFYEPTNTLNVGMNEFLPIQLLLDTCANTEDAKRELCLNKHYYRNVPVHLLVVDRFGNSFVWEYSSIRNKSHIIEGKKEPQIITNFLLHKHPVPEAVPEREQADPFRRYQTLQESINNEAKPYSLKQIRNTLQKVSVDDSFFNTPQEDKIRTIANMEYDIDERKIRTDFYITDKLVEETGSNVPVRSEHIEMQLR